MMQGGNLVGYNPYDSKIHWFSVDNMETAHEHTGEWLTPDHLSLEYDGMMDGKKYVEKLDFTFTSATELDFKLVGTLDGKEMSRAEGIFHKKVSSGKK
jgi:hypothetical protein